METIFVNTDQQGISEDGLPTYSQNNELIIGERVEVIGPYTRIREWIMPIDRWGGWVTVMDLNLINYYNSSRFKGKCEIERIYRQVAINSELTEARPIAIYTDIEQRATKFTELNSDINPWMAYCHGGIDERNRVEQPVKEVKRAEEILEEITGIDEHDRNDVDSYYISLSYRDAIEAIHIYHAQHATELALMNIQLEHTKRLLNACEASLEQRVERIAELEYKLAGLQVEDSISNNSSSEMVEHLNTLIETIKGFEITSDVEADEDLYNQGLERGIKEINKLILTINN
ncbi:hypothetical protein [Mucilaginibacter sp. 10I4]|uniref:hypothetical protein n=1 Tax=Mucilaginibacter sp. 10I4 TaxID=3048580 RepID=UPI002B22DA93|nr:hypothetical protein [Mucilaginibacter sp. 10I4]MEB0262897.1 hypothetical protein [Mucilaginibacter sp. 10I4]